MVLLQFSWRRGSKDSRGQGFKYLFSMVVFLPYPSATLEGIETTDLFICEVIAYLSSFHSNPRILDTLYRSAELAASPLGSRLPNWRQTLYFALINYN
jgi:hypothetical protein